MTLGGVLHTHMQLIAWCHACLNQLEPDIAEMEVPEWGAQAALLEMRQPP